VFALLKNPYTLTNIEAEGRGSEITHLQGVAAVDGLRRQRHHHERECVQVDAELMAQEPVITFSKV